MEQGKSKGSIVKGMTCMRCPECRRGRVFRQKYYFPLKSFLAMNEHCPDCGYKLVSESNNGPGINYALTTILFFLNLLWYWPIFGISYMDDSIFYFLGASIFVVLLLQPYLMRLSRICYLYILVAVRE